MEYHTRCQFCQCQHPKCHLHQYINSNLLLVRIYCLFLFFITEDNNSDTSSHKKHSNDRIKCNNKPFWNTLFYQAPSVRTMLLQPSSDQDKASCWKRWKQARFHKATTDANMANNDEKEFEITQTQDNTEKDESQAFPARDNHSTFICTLHQKNEKERKNHNHPHTCKWKQEPFIKSVYEEVNLPFVE